MYKREIITATIKVISIREKNRIPVPNHRAVQRRGVGLKFR